MVSEEPVIQVGILEGVAEIAGRCETAMVSPAGTTIRGGFGARSDGNVVVLFDEDGREAGRGTEIVLRPRVKTAITLSGVTIGLQFHWERKEDESFLGSLRFSSTGNGVTAVNEIGVEEYLRSVISSEMSAEAPLELLKAHAITSRSWLVAMLDRRKSGRRASHINRKESDSEIIRWYDREDHEHFDVCADDHCQRYQGVSRIISSSATEAVDETKGTFLTFDDEVCDARFSKACGGMTEPFGNVWEERDVPYLQSVTDSEVRANPIATEADAVRWIGSSPGAYCNTNDGSILRQILPSYDRETADFFRWKVEYEAEELADILRKKSEIDFGAVRKLEPLKRGPSGRIARLKIEGTRRSVIVGRELEIRRWLSRSHLYSSAFFVETFPRDAEVPERFTLFGAGWGHGVGLCQIGAAIMATLGFSAEQILAHYFPSATMKKLYSNEK